MNVEQVDDIEKGWVLQFSRHTNNTTDTSLWTKVMCEVLTRTQTRLPSFIHSALRDSVGVQSRRGSATRGLIYGRFDHGSRDTVTRDCGTTSHMPVNK